MAGQTLKMDGPQAATGNYTNPNLNQQGTPGNGWQLTYSLLQSALVSSASDFILLPKNARNFSVVYNYAGAATSLLDVQFTNNTVAEIAAGTAIWAKLPAAQFPQAVGGTASAGVVDGCFTAIRVLNSGTGQVGTDVITVCVKSVSRIDN